MCCMYMLCNGLWIKNTTGICNILHAFSLFSHHSHKAETAWSDWSSLNYPHKRRMGGGGNGFHLKFKWNRKSCSECKKKKKRKTSFLPHTDYHNSLRLCVCIQSSASVQGYLCSIIDADHWEGVSEKLFLIWLPSPMNFSCPSKLSLPLHLWLATQTITSTTASEEKDSNIAQGNAPQRKMLWNHHTLYFRG